jgi:hypothetical protein
MSSFGNCTPTVSALSRHVVQRVWKQALSCDSFLCLASFARSWASSFFVCGHSNSDTNLWVIGVGQGDSFPIG